MPTLQDASPQISVKLYKTISRKTVDGQVAASARYQGKDEFIDLTPFLAEGSAVRTSKNPREPAGGFILTFADKAHAGLAAPQLESVYGLVEPMDGIEIRMWKGFGAKPAVLPIVMRGFVTSVTRAQTMGENGKPMRQVVISGQDYGKIWQMYQILFLQAYSEGKALLTSYAWAELFGITAKNTLPVGDFVRLSIEKVINPFLKNMLPEHWAMPREIKLDITVKRGVLGNNFMSDQGSINEILRNHTDVPTWNELYIEDREDGVYCVFRPIPALRISGGDIKARKIQSDAPDPVFVEIEDSFIESQSVERSDANVANFYWVNNSHYDLIDEMQRKLQSIPARDKRVSADDYPNAAAKYYGTRPMYAATVLAGDGVTNIGSGQSGSQIAANGKKVESWLDTRRRELMDMNKDNVVFERGSARVKGGQMRPDGKETMKAGDYARFKMGRLTWDAYAIQIDHEFLPFQSYTQTVAFERGEGFVKRIELESGAWLTEQARRA
jgi:hypothetical protein